MLEKYIPLDTLLSYSEQTIFKIENILCEADVNIEDFSDFLNTILDDDYYNYQTDLSLMKLVYWYILDKVEVQTEAYLLEIGALCFNDIELSIISPLDDHIEIEEENGLVSYTCNKKEIAKVKERINIIPFEEQSRTVKWFIEEFERCTNYAIYP